MGVAQLALHGRLTVDSSMSIGFRYGADTRGNSPFVPKCPVIRERRHSCRSVLPCLHEISDYLGTTDPTAIQREFLRHLKPGYNVWCIHDYYEGVLRRPVFEARHRALIGDGWTWFRSRALADQLSSQPLIASRIVKARMPGGRGEVSCQEGTGAEVEADSVRHLHKSGARARELVGTAETWSRSRLCACRRTRTTRRRPVRQQGISVLIERKPKSRCISIRTRGWQLNCWCAPATARFCRAHCSSR